jgi:hypothetical protein
MGVGIIVHGYIVSPHYFAAPESNRIHRANRRVLRGLPVSDSEWPFITREMFSLLPLRRTSERRIPQYEHQVIHFAGEYKNMYVLEADWVLKFEERLLSRLCWYRAAVIVEFTHLLYEWEVPRNHVGYRSDPPEPPTQWSFRCSRIQAQALVVSDAVDGVVASPYHVEDSDSR